jgi:hypothetical protein
MNVLRVFRLCIAKEKEACHAKLRDDISEFVILFKSQCNAFSVSLHPFHRRTVVPRERGQPFPDNIRSPHPALVELCAEEMNPYLPGNDFGFR